jgi:hypothetical protein
MLGLLHEAFPRNFPANPSLKRKGAAHGPRLVFPNFYSILSVYQFEMGDWDMVDRNISPLL